MHQELEENPGPWTMFLAENISPHTEKLVLVGENKMRLMSRNWRKKRVNLIGLLTPPPAPPDMYLSQVCISGSGRI